MSGKNPTGVPLASTLVQVNRWLASLRDDGIEAQRIAAKAELQPGSELIEKIAESLIRNADGVERKLLSKSLQEALFYYSGLDSELNYARFKMRFSRSLDRQGASPFIQRFLAYYFFNFVWFHISDAFRSPSSTAESFAKDMEGVERMCQRAVSAAWKSFEQSNGTLSPNSAAKLVRSIESGLRGSIN